MTESPVFGSITITGSGLVALAAATRLARWGHKIRAEVTVPANLEPVITLPAAWKDLFKKSGRSFDAAMGSANLSLIEAPPAQHLLVNGTELTLPTQRAAMIQTLTQVLGTAPAQRWTAMLDDADQVWQRLRLHGTERPFNSQTTPPPLTVLGAKTMGELADKMDDETLRSLLFAEAIRAGASNPETAPALLASRWSILRTFGRWLLIDSDSGEVKQPDALVGLLMKRLIPLEETDLAWDHTIDTLVPQPPKTRWPWQTAIQPASRPHIASHVEPGTAPWQEVIEHTSTGHPIISWASGKTSEIVHDHRPDHSTADLNRGWALDSPKGWLNRPPLEATGNPPVWRASAASHAGNESWAQLLSGALVSYLVHEALTGQDIRPTNTTPPPRPRLR